jgi:hypothetical protein
MPKRRQLDLGSIEEDPSSPKRPKQLTWRRDPGESLSDWTIIVKQKPSDEAHATPSPATYHIHKNVVGAGPRRSEYFLKVFQNTDLEESKTSTSVLELESSAAKIFPLMLDFIYSLDREISLTPRCAVAMRHLASYFRVPPLFDDTNEFIERNMEPCNLYRYLGEAKLYQDGDIICATMEVAADNWLSFFAPTENTSVEPRSELYLKLLPQEKQLEFMRLALQRAVSVCRSFKRVPLPGTECEQQDGKVITWENNGQVRPRGGRLAMDYSQTMKVNGRVIGHDFVALDLYFRDGGGSSSSESDDEE